MVVTHKSEGPITFMVLQDPDRPEYGSIQLMFTDNPVQLSQWIVDDNSGRQTQIVLGDWVQGQELPNILFNIQAEMENQTN